MMDFSMVKSISITEGTVQKITAGDTVLWQQGPGYTNLLPRAVDGDGNPYNGGLGYKTGYRVNSSYQEVAQTGMCCTGFIPVRNADVVRVKNITVAGTAGGYILHYDADKNGIAPGGASTLLKDPVNGVYTFTPVDRSALAYIRISIGAIDDNTIITVNEEIPA